MVSMMNGWSLEKATSVVRSGSLGSAGEALSEVPIRLDYNASPTLDDIEIQLEAYEEVYGDYPALVVVDNITNLATGEDDPFSGLEALMDYLHKMARDTGACVIGLHHVNADYVDADKPIPMSGVKGQITRVPEMVLTLRRTANDFGPDTLYVSAVKNRSGKADSSGRLAAELDFDGDTMTLKDKEYQV